MLPIKFQRAMSSIFGYGKCSTILKNCRVKSNFTKLHHTHEKVTQVPTFRVDFIANRFAYYILHNSMRAQERKERRKIVSSSVAFQLCTCALLWHEARHCSAICQPHSLLCRSCTMRIIINDCSRSSSSRMSLLEHAPSSAHGIVESATGGSAAAAVAAAVAAAHAVLDNDDENHPIKRRVRELAHTQTRTHADA